MIVSLDNLKAGLDWWLKEKFPTDILNAEYYEIYNARSAGATQQWLTITVDRLGRWRAYRGRKPPNTKNEITQGAFSCLSAMSAECKNIAASSSTEPSITDLCWEDVAPLFALAFGIKRSSVFASKMCHFIFPKLFIPMDNLATDVFEYEFYWRGMRDEWCRSKDKAAARNLLKKAIVSDKPVHALYPFETKVMELSHIGWKHGSRESK